MTPEQVAATAALVGAALGGVIALLTAGYTTSKAAEQQELQWSHEWTMLRQQRQADVAVEVLTVVERCSHFAFLVNDGPEFSSGVEPSPEWNATVARVTAHASPAVLAAFQDFLGAVVTFKQVVLSDREGLRLPVDRVELLKAINPSADRVRDVVRQELGSGTEAGPQPARPATVPRDDG